MNRNKMWSIAWMMALLSLLPMEQVRAQMASSGPPEWTRTIPTGELYTYFRGDAVDANLEKAKLKARADALRKAQMQGATGTTDVLVDRVKVDTETDSLSTESSVAFGAAKIVGLEWVGDFSEVVPQNGVAVYHYYVLVRVPKSRAGVAARIAGGITGRADAVFHSAIFPGWGQWRQGRKGEAVFFAITTPIAAMMAGLCYAGEHNQKFTARQQANWRTARKGSEYVALGLYGVNLIDALLLGHKAREYRAVSFYPGGMAISLGHRR